MIPLLLLGISHHNTPIDVRERVTFSPEMIESALQRIVQEVGVMESALVSTCNRTEIYVTFSDTSDVHTMREELLSWLANYHHIDISLLRDGVYCYHDHSALRHMMCVASGLDSLIVGEPQILGQMKSGYAVAQKANTLASGLHRIFQKVFATAKIVRTHTAIGENPVSVAYAAVGLAQQIFSDLQQDTALLIGAGKTIDSVARHLHRQGIAKMIFANRTLSRARELATEFAAEAVLLSDIPEQLAYADIIISSTASQLPVLGKGAVESAFKQRRHKPVLMIDIAVPRDIETEVGELPDVYLYTVDDLREVIDSNKQSRAHAASEARQMIDVALDEFRQESRIRHSAAAIKSYRQYVESLRDEVLEKALCHLHKGASAETVLTQMANTLTNKLLHIPTRQLQQAGTEGNEELLTLTRKLFTDIDKSDKAANKKYRQ